jgi:15-cis-phytoene synthase
MMLVGEARQTTHRVARTFALACRLLPAAVRDDVYLLYYVFRSLDDLVDEGFPDARERVAAVEAWASFEAGPQTREVTVLEHLASRHAIPRAALGDFCAGMRTDLDRVPMTTETDVDRYCYQVAGTVGLVMASILGTVEPVRAQCCAAALGMAMQRTNILRDIDEDRANGRTYLAEETIARFGGSVEPGAREALLRDQIARADALYAEGAEGIPLLRSGRWAIGAAAVMYREILRQIERDGYGARAGRAVVPQRRKLALAVRATLPA